MRLASLSVLAVAAAIAPGDGAAEVITFQDLDVPAAGYFNGDPGDSPTNESWELSTPWVSGWVAFSNTAGRDVGSYGEYQYNYTYWSGFAYSNVVNTTDAAFTNQYASYPGGGYQSSTYAVAYDAAAIALPVPTTVSGFRIANTTYAALSLLNGDEYNLAGPLLPGGWFATTVTGKLGTTTTGSSTFYLADRREASSPGILADWAWFDLTGLGTVNRLEFSFDGTQKNAQGLLTPAYFAMDNLTVAAVPEPATLTLLGTGAIAAVMWARRRAGRS
jgi:hypothetical protein